MPLTAPSPAKLNLTLRVTGVRPDGFHELESLVALVNLVDTLTVELDPDGTLSLACDDPRVPTDERNLVLQAARCLRLASGTRTGARFTLTKRIPLGAGLGGGSSNAATALRLLNDLWGLDRPMEELAAIGGVVGSDVPLFFHGPLCIMRGRGERVTHEAATVTGWAALVLPELECATPKVYAAWDRLAEHPPRPALADIRAALGHVDTLMPLLFNDLEDAAQAEYPELADLLTDAAAAAGGPFRLTGSGAAIFRLFGDMHAAARAALDVGRTLGVRCDLVSLVT